MLQTVLLGLMQIAEQGAGSACCLLFIGQSQGSQLIEMKMIKKGIFCILSLEPDPRLTVQSPDIRAGHSRQFRRIITDHFHRIDSGNLCTKHIDFRFHHKKLTGGYIGIGDPCFFSVQVNTHQIIV